MSRGNDTKKHGRLISCKVLVVDDSPEQRSEYAGLLTRKAADSGNQKDGQEDPVYLLVSSAHSYKEALSILDSERFDVLVSDFYLRKESADDFLKLIEGIARLPRQYSPDNLSVVLVSTNEDANSPDNREIIERAKRIWSHDNKTNTITEVLKCKVLKSEDENQNSEMFLEQVWNVVMQQIEKFREKSINIIQNTNDEIIFQTNDSKLKQLLYSRIKEVAEKSDSPILITGETGTGKGLLAKQIHKWGNRRGKKMFAINCAAIPESLVESELFGHKKGSFTGAITDKDGYFKLADGSTLFLDEIGELSMQTQAKLLRVLEEKEIIPVGATRVETVDCRIIAATNRDIQKMIKDGKFHKDLYYRLSKFEVNIPPLRDRKKDIPLLAELFWNQECSKLGKSTNVLISEIKDFLAEQKWNGNARDLQNVIGRLAIFHSENLTIEKVTQELTERPYYSGLDVLTTLNARLQHQYVWRPSIEAVKRDNVAADRFQSAFIEYINKNFSHLFPKLDGSEIYDKWRHHVGDCSWCRENGPSPNPRK